MVVGHRAAPKGEASVPPTCAGGDRARLIQPDANTGLGERERAGASGDAAAHDGDVHGTRVARPSRGINRLVQPEGRLHVAIVDRVIELPGTPRPPPPRAPPAPALSTRR